MKQKQAPQQENPSQALIGEMMLAKTVLEEKNELLDQKDQLIQELMGRGRQLEQEVEELKKELTRSESEADKMRDQAVQEGAGRVVAEVVHLISEYEPGDRSVDRTLVTRLMRLFQERYALEVIEGTPAAIDPRIHHVLEVAHNPLERSSLQVLEKGFRLAGRTIKPALLRVIKGGESIRQNPTQEELQDPEPWRAA